MKGKDLLHALDGIDESVLAEAMKGKKPRRHWRIPALAACLALVIGITALAQPGAANIPRLDPANSFGGAGLRIEGQVPDNSKGELAGHQQGFAWRPVVLARAVEVLPEVYASLPAYGSLVKERFRIFRMEITDGLDSGLTGEFWFGIPEAYYEDLTGYETLMISLKLRGQDYSLQNTITGQLRDFDLLYVDTWCFYGDIIAFRDGVFDESLWKSDGWMNSFFCVYKRLDWENNSLVVQRGSTIQDVLEELETRKQSDPHRYYPGYTNEDLPAEVLAVLEEMQAQAGTYVGTSMYGRNNYGSQRVYYTRYIAGCPTNEFVCIDRENGQVWSSGAQFTQQDLEKLPDLSAYMDSLDLDAITTGEGQTLRYRAVYGWYNKLADGQVYAFVKIIWGCSTEDGKYQDLDAYISVTQTGATFLTREQMKDLLGDDPNIGPLPKVKY